MMITSHRSTRTVAIASAVIVSWLILNAYLLDGVLGWFWTAIGAAPTEFAPGYSGESFRRIKSGMSTEEVRRVLGAPLYVSLTYSNGNRLQFEGLGAKPYNGIGSIASHVTKEAAQSDFGDPKAEAWTYGRSPTTSPYSVRLISFERGRVVRVTHELAW